MKQLTEKQAWLKIAKYFDSPRATQGLCAACSHLGETREVTLVRQDRMLIQMELFAPDDAGGYWWARMGSCFCGACRSGDTAAVQGNAERVMVALFLAAMCEDDA